MRKLWKSININKKNIKHDTGKSVLISCPQKSEYDGYCFWHPSKLVKEGKNSCEVTISYTSEFNFTLKKYCQGRFNRSEVIESKTISASAFDDAFCGKWKQCENDMQPAIHVPKKLEPEQCEAKEELVDND